MSTIRFDRRDACAAIDSANVRRHRFCVGRDRDHRVPDVPRYGLGWDDYTHAEYAELLLQLYRSGFGDKSALSFVNLYMYGGGFDMAAALLHKILPLDLFETRRLVGAFVGVIGIALDLAPGRRVGGPVAGLVALILIAVCPAFYGHIFMNPKDIPFAIAMVVFMLGLVRLVEEYPQPSPRTILIVGLGAGLRSAAASSAGLH